MQVTVHKSTDGKFFESFEEFKAHEEALLVNAGLGLVELDTSVAFVPDDVVDIKVVAVTDLHKFVAANAAVLREVLNASVVTSRKPRGPNKSKEAVAA